MSDCTGDFSIEVNETKYIIEVESCINSTGINNITLSPTSGANIEINTCMIPASHPVVTPAPNQDNSGNVFVQDVFLDGNGHVTGLLSAGVNFSGYTQSGDNVSIFVNDAGYMTSYSETGLNTFLTGISFNCSTKELLEHLNDGTHITGDLSCLVVSGYNVSLFTNDSGYATTGQLASTSGHLQGQIDAIPADTNTFVSGVQYDTAQRDIILTRTDSVTLTGNLDVVVHSGDNVSKLTNDAGYITGYTETDPIFSASPASSISSGDITNWNDAYGWGDHSTSGYLVSGDNVSLLNNDVPYAVSGSHIEVNAASDSDNSGQVFIQDLLVDEYGHVTGLATATASGQVYTAGTGLALAGNQFNIDETVIQSGDNVSLLVNDAGYLTSGTNHSVTGASFDCSTKELSLTQTDGSTTTGDLGCVVVSGDNISLLANDAGYITGYIETGVNTFVTGLTFNSGTNNLVLQRNDSATITGQLDGVLVSGTSYHISVNGTGVDGSGRTYVQDILVDSYGHITGITTATETEVDTNTEYTAGTGLSLDGTQFNISGVETSLLQGTVDNNQLTSSSFILNAGTGLVGGGEVSLGNSGTLNIDSSVVQSGDNISVLSNDAGYITGYTETGLNTFVTGAVYTPSNNHLVLSRNDGDQVTGILASVINTGNVGTYPVWLTDISASIITSGTIDAARLPAYVDDVIEASGTGNFPATGETGKIYVDTSENFSYRWGGSQYVQMVDGKASWGGIDGDLNNQTDLWNYLQTGHIYVSGVSSDNSGRTYIQDVLTDTYGHVTGLTTATESSSGSLTGGGSANQIAKWTSSSAVTGSNIYIDSDDTMYWQYPGKALDSASSGLGYFRLYDDGVNVIGMGVSTSNFNIGTLGGVDMRILVAGQTRMTLKQSGRIGLSTTIPTENLHVASGIRNDGWVSYSDTVQNSGTGIANGTAIKLGETFGTTLSNNWHYIIRLSTFPTATQNGSSYLVWYDLDTTTWKSRFIGRSGSTTNHPQVGITGTSPTFNAVFFDENAASYTARYIVEAYKTSEDAATPHSMGANYHWQRDVNDLVYEDGNVGIGTGNPAGKLHVETKEAQDSIVIGRGASRSSISAFGGSDTKDQYLALDSNGQNLLLNFFTDDNVQIAYGGGNVCVGSISSPISKLQVSASGDPSFYLLNLEDDTAIAADVGGGMIFRGKYTSGGSKARFAGIKAGKDNATDANYSGYLKFETSNGSTLSESMRITSDGNVGIGTDSPALQSAGQGLHINATGTSSEIKFTNSVTNSTASDGTALVATSSSFTINNREAGALNLNTNNTNAISIDSAQRVGIGTGVPAGRLHVVGTSFFRGDIAQSGGSVVFNQGGEDYNFRIEGDTDQYLLFVDGGTDQVGIGTATPTRKLDVDGNAQIGGLTMGSGVFSTGFPGITNTNSYGDTTSYAMVAGPTQTVVNGQQGTFFRVSGDQSKQYSINHTAATQTINSNQTSYRAGSTVFNELSGNIDFKIHTNNTHNTFYVDGATHQVGIGTNNIGSGDVLNVNGATMFSGARPVHINVDGGGEYISKKGDSGGWAFDIRGIGNSGTIYTGLGWYGSDDTLLWQFWGGSYINPWIKQTTSETTFNETAENRDFRVEGQAETHLIFADASNSNVGIGQSAPKSRLTVTADANDEYGIRLGNAAGGGGSVSGISKLGLDHWAPTLNHPAVSLTVQETSTASYSADLLIQTRTQNADIAPITRYHFLAGGRLGVGGYPTSKGSNASGLVDVYGPVLARGGVASNQTSAGALDFANNILRIRSWGSGAGQGEMQFRVAGGGGSIDSACITLQSGLEMIHHGSSATIAEGSSYELDISSSAATLAGNRFQILSSETVVNNAGSSLDFRVEGNTDTSLLHVDASADNVGIGVSAPTEKLQVDGIIRASGIGQYNGTRGTFMAYPGGGQFATANPTMTGHLKITYPQSWLNVMINAEVDIYEYNAQDLKSIKFGGYQYSTSTQWINTAASMDANYGDEIRYNVKFGHDGSKCAVYISKSDTAGTDLGDASVWYYPQAVVHDVHAAFSSTNSTMDRWADGWDVGVESGVGTISSTRYLGRAYHLHENQYVFNELGGDVDFRVEGENKQNLLNIDASSDRVGINQPSPATLLDINAVGEGAGTKVLFKYDDDAYVSFQHSGGDFLKLGQMYTNNIYMGLSHSNFTNSSYMIMSEGSNTFISAGSATAGRVYLRGNRNDSSYEIKINPVAGEIVVNDQGSDVDFRVEGNGDSRLLHVDAGLNSVGIGTGVPSTVSSANRGKLHVVNDESTLADFLVGDPNSQKPYFGIKMASAFISAIFGPSQSSKLGGGLGTPDTCRIRYYGGPSDSGTYWTQESNFQDYELIPYLAEVSQGSKFKVDVSGAVTFNNAFTFPTGDGTNGQTLVTDGAGSISWGAGASSSSDAVRGTVSVTTTTGIFAVGGGYTTGALDVYLNGIKLADTIDYTATNGTSISLTSPATSGDILSYVGYDRLTVAGTLQDTGDTVNGNFTVNGDLVVMGYKETHTDNGSTGASQTIAITGSTIQTFTLTNNCVFTLPSADAGRSFTVLLKTGAGSFTASFTGTDPVKFPSNATPSITTSGSRMDVFTFISDGTNWYGDSQQDYHV